jgi:hypothetical protein
VRVRLLLARLVDDQYVLEAAKGNCRFLANLVHHPAICEFHLGRPALRITRRSELGLSRHYDPRLGAFDAVNPAGSADELIAVVFLGILAH